METSRVAVHILWSRSHSLLESDCKICRDFLPSFLSLAVSTMHPLLKKEHAHFEEDFGAQRLKKDRGSELKEVVMKTLEL